MLNLLKMSGCPNNYPSKSVGTADNVLLGAYFPNAIISLIFFTNQFDFSLSDDETYLLKNYYRSEFPCPRFFSYRFLGWGESLSTLFNPTTI
jgi:hypothetical protein